MFPTGVLQWYVLKLTQCDEYNIVSISHSVSTQRGVMVAVNSSRDLSTTVGDFLKSLNLTASNKPHISRPFHDTAGKGTPSQMEINASANNMHQCEVIHCIVF